MTYTSKIKTQFAGISQPAPPTFVDPPHNALAVGPSNAVMVDGSSIEWTDLAGGNGTTTSVYSFFNSLGATADNALFDPRAVFDSVSGRYIVTMNNLGPGQTSSTVDIAVSNDSNPNDGWSFAALNTTATINGQATLSDQPILAVDGTNIYITTPQFNATGGAFAGTEQWVISDAAGNGTSSYPLTLKASPVAPTGEGVMRVAAGSNGTTFYAGAVNNGGETVVTLQNYNVASGVFSFPTSIPLGNSDQGNGSANYTAQQKGTNVLLDAGDGKIQNLAYANGFLYGVSEVTPVGSSAPEIHWFKIDVSNPSSPTLAAQGDISGAAIGAGVAVFDASIAVDSANDVIINFTASGPNMFPGDYYVFHGGTDPATSFSAPVSYQASNSFLANGDGPTLQRWGINSSAIADPNNPGSFWLSSEFVTNGLWQTSVAQVQVKPGPAVTAGATASFTGGGAPVALDNTLTVTDPSSATIASATVSIGSGFLNGDSLLFTNQHGISGSYDALHGILTLTGISSVANYQTALDSITYSFSPANGDPTGGGGNTSRTINWAVNDGTSSSTTVTSTLNAVHAPPTVTAGATATFTGGGGAVTLDGALAVSDPDSGGNLTGATVSIGSGFLSGDTLNFTNQNGINGVYDAVHGLLTLVGTSSVANYQAALDSITFSFNPGNGDPTGGGTHTNRSIGWTVSDSASSSTMATSTLTTTHTGPTVTAGAMATIMSGGAAVTLDSGLTLADPDSTTIASATVSIGTGLLNGDTLNFTNQNGINGTYDAAHGVLKLTGTSSVANYQTALDSITYNFSPANGDPTAAGRDPSRTIDWVVNDGVANSNTATSTLAMPTASALVQSSNGALDYLEFAGTNLVASDLVSFSSWPVVAEGDFNHDGHTELVIQDQHSGSIDLLSVNKGVLQGSLLEQGSYWKVVGAGDFDGSGRTGIATQNSATGQIDLLWFTGTQLTSSLLLDGSYQHVAGVADFNGDGKADLVTQNPSGGQLDFLFFTNTHLTASALTPDYYWAVHDVMNSGGPGQSLMVSQDQTSGQLDYLHFNGTTIASTMLEANSLPGLTAVQGTDAAAQLFKG